MTIRLGEHAIEVTGVCDVGEAEALVFHLQSRPDLPVDISGATRIHTSLWQVLMVFKPDFNGSQPVSSLLAGSVLSALRANLDESAKS